jgi:hypothetical protein
MGLSTCRCLRSTNSKVEIKWVYRPADGAQTQRLTLNGLIYLHTVHKLKGWDKMCLSTCLRRTNSKVVEIKWIYLPAYGAQTQRLRLNGLIYLLTAHKLECGRLNGLIYLLTAHKLKGWDQMVSLPAYGAQTQRMRLNGLIYLLTGETQRLRLNGFI